MTDTSWLTALPVAHRGFHDLNDKRWENTLAAFEEAASRGYAIECDVRLSSDGVPVIFHDAGLGRLAGINAQVWQRTAAEFGALRIGGTDDHAPTLKEALDLVRGRVPLLVELKGAPGRDTGLVEKVCELLRAYGREAAIMSFDHWLIRRMPPHTNGIPYGLTACGLEVGDIEAHFAMLAHGISFASYAVADLPNPFVSFLRERLGLPVITWTVREEAEVRKTFELADQMTFEGFVPDVRVAL